jgi:RNA polymerase-binding transcription factor DksA
MTEPESKAARSLPGGPRWRTLLETRWRDRLQLVTELSLQYHDTAAAAPLQGASAPAPALQRLMRQTSSARRALADTDEALARLAAGRFGRCENCGAPIPARTLRAEPEARYCARCAEPALMGSGLSVVTA